MCRRTGPRVRRRARLDARRVAAPHAVDPRSVAREFYGLSFTAWKSAAASAAALDRRGIPHAEPTGDSVRIDDADLRAPNVYVGIGWAPDAEKLRETRSLFLARGGGPLGLVHVEEVRIGYSDAANLEKWIAFLAPAEAVGERAFRIGDGPVLRFVENDVKQVLGITLKVRSLEKAAAFLRGEGLLGHASESLELDRVRTRGLPIRLQE